MKAGPTIGVVVAAIFAVLIATAFTSCSDELDKPIRIVLPNDYLGGFEIRPGTDPVEQTNNAYILRIPRDGVLHSQGHRLFYKWHKRQIEYEDGRWLLDLERRDGPQASGIEVLDEGTSSEGVHSFRVVIAND